MVLVHELGHLLAARLFKVRVEAFAFGFGPRLFGFKHGDTDYKVCLLPLGGFVKMSGENVGEPSDEPDSLLSKPRWQRIIIAFAGPLFNGILSVVLLVGLFMTHYERPTFWAEPAVIGYVEDDSPAKRAGVAQGDEVVSFDGEPTPDWDSLRRVEATAALKRVEIEVRREGRIERMTFGIDAGMHGIGAAGWHESAPVRLGRSQPGAPASKADIKPNDVLVAIDGEQIDSVAEVFDLIGRSGGTELTLDILRGTEVHQTKVTPEYDEPADAWRIGIYLGPAYDMVVTRAGLGEAFRLSLKRNAADATLIFRFLEGLFEQRMSARSLQGPLGIAQMSGEAAEAGWPALIQLMAGISLNLGIFNLFPIPILDGGVILMLLVESVIRRDVSLAVKERIMQVGLVALMLLFAFVMYNDILRALPS